MNNPPVNLILCDVDGTLIRNQTLCQIIAKNIGKLDRMNWFEENAGKSRARLISAREEMARWYLDIGETATLRAINGITWAPNVQKSLKTIHDAGIILALASVTWEFAVKEVASHLGIELLKATKLDWATGEIDHMYPDLKAEYLADLANQHKIPLSETLAIGDSSGDIPMLKKAGRGIFVGENDPGIENVMHRPNMDYAELTQLVLSKPRRS